MRRELGPDNTTAVCSAVQNALSIARERGYRSLAKALTDLQRDFGLDLEDNRLPPLAPHHANTIKEADAFGQGAVHFTDVDGGLLRLPAPVHQVPHGTRWSFEFRGFHFWVSTFHVLGPESAPPPWTLLWRDPFGDRGRKACSDLREVYHHAAGLIARSQISSEGL